MPNDADEVRALSQLSPEELADLLRKMAVDVDSLDFLRMMAERSKNGFKHMILDLRDYHSRLEKAKRQSPGGDISADYPEPKGNGWELQKDGLLVVQRQCVSAEIEQFLGHRNVLGSYPWYQGSEEKPDDMDFLPPVLPQGYDQYIELFKTLGKWGENEAMDVIILLMSPDGSIHLKGITRRDGTFAYIGGILEAGDESTERSIREIFEELYSLELFTAGSRTEAEASKLKPHLFAAAMKGALEMKDFELLQLKLKEQIMKIAASEVAFPSKLRAIEKCFDGVVGQSVTTVDSTGESLAFRSFGQDEFYALQVLLGQDLFSDFRAACPHLAQKIVDEDASCSTLKIFQSDIVSLRRALDKADCSGYASKLVDATKEITLQSHMMKELFLCLKCRLYQCLFDKQYGEVRQFFLDHFVDMPKVVNAADPRNTRYAWMTTVPRYILYNSPEFANMEAVCYLKANGGSDAVSVKIRPVDVLTEEGRMYSSHSGIGLRAIADALALNPGIKTEKFLAQVDKMQEQIKRRQLVSLSMGSNGDSCFPLVSSLAAAGRYASLVSSENAGQGSQVSGSAEGAIEYLKESLGASRFSRIMGYLEYMRIPATFLETLMLLHRQYPVVTIVIDDSSSMSYPMTIVDENTGEQVFNVPRIREARNRFMLLFPVLALAGIKIRVMSLNESIDQKEYSFVRQISDQEKADIEWFEAFLARTVSELEGTFVKLEYNVTRKRLGTPIDQVLEQLSKSYKNGQEKGCMTYFITDGQPDDPGKAQKLLYNLSKGDGMAVNFVCCTDEEEGVLSWASAVSRNKGCRVALVSEYHTEANRLPPTIPFNRNIWLALQITPADHLSGTGLALYRKAAIPGGPPLTREELCSMLALPMIEDAVYHRYLAEVEERNAKQLKAAAAIPARQMGGSGQFFTPSSVSVPPGRTSYVNSGAGMLPSAPQGCPPGFDPIEWGKFQEFKQLSEVSGGGAPERRPRPY